MAHKTLINETGHALDVTLIIRRGDHPSDTAGTVDVQLPPHDHRDDESDDSVASTQTVAYGDDVNIYLNGVELTMTRQGQRETKQNMVAERGSELDNALNMNDTLEFRFDGRSLVFSARNANQAPPTFELTPLTPLKLPNEPAATSEDAPSSTSGSASGA